MERYTFGPGTLYLRKSMFPSDGQVALIIRDSATIVADYSRPPEGQTVIIDGKRLPYDPRRGWSFFAPPEQWRCISEATCWPEMCDAGVHCWRYSDGRLDEQGRYVGGAIGSTRRCAACGLVYVRDPDVWPPPGTDGQEDDAAADDEDDGPPGG